MAGALDCVVPLEAPEDPLEVAVDVVVAAAPATGELFGPRGGILSSTLDFLVTVSVVLWDCETYPPFSTKTRSY